jgi:hypothetical protein
MTCRPARSSSRDMTLTSFFRRIAFFAPQTMDIEKATESTPLLPTSGRLVERYRAADKAHSVHPQTAEGSASESTEGDAYHPCRLRASNADYTIAAFIIGTFTLLWSSSQSRGLKLRLALPSSGAIMIIAHYPWIGWASDLIKRDHTVWGLVILLGWYTMASTVVFYVTIATLDRVAFDVAWHRAPTTDDSCHSTTPSSR